MDHKSLIIDLIAQEFKYYKLVNSMEKLCTDLYKGGYPENTSMIARLMGLEPEQITNDWQDAYMKYMYEFDEKGHIDHEKILHCYAEACYEKLLELRNELIQEEPQA